MPDNGGQKDKNKSLTAQIQEIDKRLIRDIIKRTKLMRKAANSRLKKGLSMVDPAQEKKIWKEWNRDISEEKLDSKTMRMIFNLVNNLAYEEDVRTEKKEVPLQAAARSVSINTHGPVDTGLTRMWLALSSADDRPMRISPCVLNDPVVELVKALNLAEGNFSWGKELIEKKAGGRVDFDHKVVFAGDDPLNMYLLLFLSCHKPGTCKFTGGSRLKWEDLHPMAQVLPYLGARLASLVPGNPGLPVRIEASGQVQSEIPLPDGASPDMIQSLLLALALFKDRPADIYVKWPPKEISAGSLARAENILHTCRVETKRDDQGVHVYGQEPVLPEDPEIPLDIALSAYVLALPQLVGGRVSFSGSWPQWQDEHGHVLSMFKGFGPEIEFDRTKPRTKTAEQVQGSITLAQDNRLLPLVFVLAAVSPGRAVLLDCPEQEMEFAAELMEKLGMEFSFEQGRLEIGEFPGARERLRLTPPDPWWIMAVSLLGLKRGGIAITNPGEVTSTWPGFLPLIRSLAKPEQKRDAGGDSGEDKAGRKKQRYIVK